LLYTLGRAITYTALALIIFFGADQLKFSGFFQQHGEKIVGPLLVIIGLFMLDVFRINFPGLGGLATRMQNKKKWSYADAILLGLLFALAFCPYSGVLYFGMLVPLTVSSTSGLYLPVVFAIATGIPVIIFAWIHCLHYLRNRNRLQQTEKLRDLVQAHYCHSLYCCWNLLYNQNLPVIFLIKRFVF
jgi:cytochrome c-type biogenesis protein